MTQYDRDFIFLLNNDVNSLFFNVNKFFLSNIDRTSLTIKLDDNLKDEVKIAEVKQFLKENLLINGRSIFYQNPNNREDENDSFLVFEMNAGNREFKDYSQDFIYSFMLKNSYKECISLDLTLSIWSSGGIVPSAIPTDYNIKLYIDSNLTFSDIYQKTGNLINTKHSSFMLARTNPKLTGNIKFVVDSEYKLYLDTFKVTDVLSNKKYRHQPISSDGNYPRDVKAIFSSLPKGELYKYPEDSLKTTKVYSDYDYQFDSRYEYGAETNKDRLYSENMRILAPLYLGYDNLPDFFCIFREPKNIDFDYSNIQDTELVKSYFEKGKVVKIFDLRKYTTIGEYLNNYKNLLNDVQSGAHIQFLEQEIAGSTNFWKNGTNYWSGVSIDRGILTSKMETSYFQNNIIKNEGTNESLYGFILDGYERNNLLYPNILNLEFMFNDDSKDVENYDINKYAGFYLKENDFLSIGGVVKDLSNTTKQELTVFDSAFNKIDVFDSSLYNFLDNYQDRIKFAITNNSATKVNSSQELNSFVSKNIVNKPDKNIINVNAKEVDLDSLNDLSFSEEDVYTLKYSEQKKSNALTSSFISIKFTKPINYGEHFRIIVFEKNNVNTVPTIYEILASNDERLAGVKDNITQYIQTNKRFLDEDTIDASVYFASSYRSFGNSSSGLPNDPTININSIKNSSLFTYQLLDNNGKFVRTKDGEYIKQDVLDFPYHYLTWDSKELFTLSNKNYRFNKKDTLWTGNRVFEYPNIYRLAFYTQDLDDKNKVAPLSVQIERIVQCIKKFNVNDFYVSSFSEDSLGLIAQNFETYFQHIDKPYLGELGVENKDDSLYYFTDKNVYKMNLLSNNTLKYDKDTAAFALYNFEMLGDRFSSVIKFIKFENYFYSLSKSIRNYKQMEQQLLALTFTAGDKPSYEILKSFNIETYNIDVNQDISTKHLTCFNDDKIIINPFDVKNDLICSSSRLVLRDNVLNLYTPLGFSLSIMGVLGFKDFYTYFNLNTEKIFHSSNRLNFERDVDLKKYLKTGVLYKLVSGSIKDVKISTGKTFYYINDTIYYYDSNIDKLEHHRAVNVVTGSDNTVIEVETKNADNFDFKTKTPVIIYENLYNKNKNADNELKYSISIPSIFVWQSTGVYYDRNSDLDVANLMFYNANNGYFTNMNYSLGNYDSDNFVFNNLNSTFKNVNTDELISIKKALLDKNNQTENLIRQTLINNFNLKGSTAYYNKYINTLDFVYYGIKFTININNTNYLIDINLEDYNNYEVFVVNSFGYSTKNEVYISTKEKIILLINNIYNKTSIGVNNENIIYDGKNNINNELNYSWAESAYGVDVDNILCNGRKYFLERIEKNTTDDVEVLSKDDVLYQIYGPSSIWSLGTPYVFYIKNRVDSDDSDDSVDSSISMNSYTTGFTFDYSLKNSPLKLFMNTLGEGKDAEYSDVQNDLDGVKSLISNTSLNIYNNFFNTDYNAFLIKIKPEMDSQLMMNSDKYLPHTSNSKVSISDSLFSKSNAIFGAPIESITEPAPSPSATFPSSEVFTTFPSSEVFTTDPFDERMTDPDGKPIDNIQVSATSNKLSDYVQNSWLNNDLVFNIIGENDIVTYNVTESYQPIVLTAENFPKHIKYNYDYYEPKFVDLMDFALKEDSELSKFCKQNFLLSNTLLSSVNKIPTYAGLKVFKSIPNLNIETNYFIENDRSIVRSSWNQNNYRLYSTENSYQNINGYTIGNIGGKAFFGSQCMKLDNDLSIYLDTWNYETNLLTYGLDNSNHNVNSENKKECIIRINLTKCFYDYFLYDSKNERFRNQWNIYSANNRTFILNFLKRELINFFNINNQQELIIYRKTIKQKNENPSIVFLRPEDLDSSWEIYTNYKTSYSEVNDEIILTISIADYKNSQIYPLFKLCQM